MSKVLKTIIGRFSLFHNGHEALLNNAAKTSDALLILVGSSFAARTIKNPFTFEERVEQIEAWKFNAGITIPVFILPVMDSPYNHNVWINAVQQNVLSTQEKLVADVGGEWTRVLSGADRDSSTWYLHTFGDFFEKELITENDTGVEFGMSATAAREMLFGSAEDFVDDEGFISPLKRLKNYIPSYIARILVLWIAGSKKNTQRFEALCKEFEFIQKYKKAWAAAPYVPTFVTTDAVVIQSGHVLVNVRANYPGVGLYAFPGGFLEQDETIIDGTVRELIEETKIALAPAQIYGSVVTTMTCDAPDRSLRGRTISHATLFRLNDGKTLPKIKPQAGEVAKCMWLPIAEALSDPSKWFEDHYYILQSLMWKTKTN